MCHTTLLPYVIVVSTSWHAADLISFFIQEQQLHKRNAVLAMPIAIKCDMDVDADSMLG